MKEIAYVSLFWGTRPESFIDALQLGATLRRYNTSRCILMITEDTARDAKTELLAQYWELRVVEEVPVGYQLRNVTQPRLNKV